MKTSLKVAEFIVMCTTMGFVCALATIGYLVVLEQMGI